MASELLKNKTLIQRLKEDKVPVFNFDLAGSALDYNIESIEEELLPKEKPQELFDERDRLRIESLEQSLQDNKPFLMDESVDFIERENFGGGGVTKSLGNGLYEITYKGGSKVYYVDKYVRGTGEKKKVSFGKDKQAALDYIEEFEKNQKPTTFDVAKNLMKKILKKYPTK